MIYINKITFICLLTILIIIIFVQYILLVTKFTQNYIIKNNSKINSSDIPIETIIPPIQQLPPPTIPFAPIVHPNPPMTTVADPVKLYDYNKIYDPLEDPTKRVDRYLLGPVQFRRMFNYPVRGDPDNPRWLGLLICESEDDKSNKLIKLFGRQKYPRSEQYDYYTLINMGYDQVKVKIHHKKELYDDDVVQIPEINKTYRVKLNKNDDMTYNPYF
jgi:hypothetical protein